MVIEHNLYDFNAFQFFGICIMTQGMVAFINISWALGEKTVYAAVVR